jgi:NADH:ubiquinone oxidoreductase subunit K
MLLAIGIIFIICSEEIISLFLGFEVIFFYLNIELIYADMYEITTGVQAQYGLAINLLILLIAATESAVGLSIVMLARRYNNSSVKAMPAGVKN